MHYRLSHHDPEVSFISECHTPVIFDAVLFDLFNDADRRLDYTNGRIFNG
jgi:hypothetical protein